MLVTSLFSIVFAKWHSTLSFDAFDLTALLVSCGCWISWALVMVFNTHGNDSSLFLKMCPQELKLNSLMSYALKL